MHQVLYRKWRPVLFSQTAGQGHIARTLLAQLQNGRLAHAYLFTGSRGTGKTTFAKILARAVNCENPDGGEPCNRCPSCLGILDGSIPDVAEIDAASQTGVDSIRALREELVYLPVAVKRRVYIIDEVHMLSVSAFNAFLKTLEEPPPHVLFILATTEAHKVPATVVSRCQRFAFRRISEADIIKNLQAICAGEGVEIEPPALDLLAHVADGALRDGQSLLEQCVSAAAGSAVTEELARETLGLSGLAGIADWLGDLGVLPISLRHLERMYEAGIEVSSMLGQLSSMLRDLLMGQMLGDLLITRLPMERAAALSAEWPRDRILSALTILQESQNRLSRCADKRLEAEMCLIRLSSPEPAEIPDKEKTVAPKSVQAQIKTVPASVHPAEPVAPPPVPEKIPVIEKTAYTEAVQGGIDAERDPRWGGFVSALDPFLRNTLKNAGTKVAGDRLVIGTDDPFALGLLGGAEFNKTVKSHFPGGLELTHGKPATAMDLDALLDAAGDLVIEE